jgi:hypothetical protein
MKRKSDILFDSAGGPRRATTPIDLNRKNRLFWILHTSGWILFLAFSLLYYQVRGILTTSIVVRYATAALAGFLSTLLLRSFYGRIKLRDRSILSLSFLAIVFSFLGANLTIWLSDIFKIPFSGTGALNENLALMYYLQRVMWWSTPIIGWSILYFGIKFWQEWVGEKARAEKAQVLAQTAQLQMLRYRLNPHFLFNALNSIRALISEDKPSAKTMITELSEFLRYSLVSKNYKNVPFKDEIDSVRHYFNIQKMRYEDNLDVSLDIDPATEEFPILSFLLHPLAENAVKYGMSTSPMPLKIQIKARIRQESLHFEIINSGSWIEPAGPKSDGVIGKGLDNIRRRLADAYPGTHHLDIFEKEGFIHARLVIDKDIRR